MYIFRFRFSSCRNEHYCSSVYFIIAVLIVFAYFEQKKIFTIDVYSFTDMDRHAKQTQQYKYKDKQLMRDAVAAAAG